MAVRLLAGLELSDWWYALSVVTASYLCIRTLKSAFCIHSGTTLSSFSSKICEEVKKLSSLRRGTRPVLSHLVIIVISSHGFTKTNTSGFTKTNTSGIELDCGRGAA